MITKENRSSGTIDVLITLVNWVTNFLSTVMEVWKFTSDRRVILNLVI